MKKITDNYYICVAALLPQVIIINYMILFNKYDLVMLRVETEGDEGGGFLLAVTAPNRRFRCGG